MSDFLERLERLRPLVFIVCGLMALNMTVCGLVAALLAPEALAVGWYVQWMLLAILMVATVRALLRA